MNLKRKEQVNEFVQTRSPSNNSEILGQLMSGKRDAAEIAQELPETQRAQIAQFCYQRVHMRELGLRIASTCNLMTLRSAFGRAGDVVYAQSRDVEKTLGALKNTPGHQIPKPITLKITTLDRVG